MVLCALIFQPMFPSGAPLIFPVNFLEWSIKSPAHLFKQFSRTVPLGAPPTSSQFPASGAHPLLLLPQRSPTYFYSHLTGAPPTFTLTPCTGARLLLISRHWSPTYFCSHPYPTGAHLFPLSPHRSPPIFAVTSLEPHPLQLANSCTKTDTEVSPSPRNQAKCILKSNTNYTSTTC